MTDSTLRPAVITALLSKAHLVREAALQLGISYSETPVVGHEDQVKFRFDPIDEATTRELLALVPREAYAYRAIIGGADGEI